jgi:hypothetical protein
MVLDEAKELMEIATGFALATTSSDCHVTNAPRNDHFGSVEANYLSPLNTFAAIFRTGPLNHK